MPHNYLQGTSETISSPRIQKIINHHRMFEIPTRELSITYLVLLLIPRTTTSQVPKFVNFVCAGSYLLSRSQFASYVIRLLLFYTYFIHSSSIYSSPRIQKILKYLIFEIPLVNYLLRGAIVNRTYGIHKKLYI